MCLMILIQGLDPEFPLLVASNRDEDRSRKAAPPGLFAGERQRMLSPRDRRGGGTWLAVNQHGLFAGITNVAGAATRPLPGSRGVLPHLALDGALHREDLDGACRAVRTASSTLGARRGSEARRGPARRAWEPGARSPPPRSERRPTC